MTFRYRPSIHWLAALAAVGCLGLTGCGSSAPEGFISDNPKGTAGDKSDDAEGSSSSGGTAGNPSADPESPERLITEADIIQVKDNKLYALSQYGGLSIIDISVQDELTLLGRYAVTGIPFEMYLKDGIVYAMFSSWGQYVLGETGTYSYVQSSRVEALDVTEPGAIHPIGSFDLPGSISDSRIVGDILYTVTFQDEYCWGCSGARNTTITSLNVLDPETIGVVDQLSFSDTDPYGYGWRRSVSVTPERMYVAGIEWNGSGNGHSTIDVVDISDPAGLLVKGDSVEATGQIMSRWQMDEHEGVLRVISQPGTWWGGQFPGIQTFSILSSQNLQPLGYTELQLPKPESLRSVRFDGERAFAITAEQTDPLFTIDLSNPAAPAQVGELEIPGWVYHMEPRGDRLLALGFDNAAAGGSLNVSLFDVSNMAQPTMIKRVAFGGQWSNLAEDQDRIHKAFSILDDQGLILVPYAGYSYNEDGYGCGSYTSGIQLIDFTANSLTKRGAAASRGQARRAFLHDDRLFAVSDEQVRTFDVNDRDQPAKTSELALSHNVTQSTVVGDLVVRVSADWWTTETRLDVVPASEAGNASPIGTLDLASLSEQSSPYECWWYGFYNVKLLSHGQHVYMIWPSSDWENPKTRAVAIDVSDPAAPKLGEVIEVGAPFWTYSYGAFGQVVAPGDPVVQSGSTLVFRRLSTNPYDWNEDPAATERAWLDIVDFANPASPAVAASVELPEGAGHTALRIEGTTVLTSHWVPLAEDPSKARFYFDRIDIANPGLPVVHDPVNVPGSLVTFDAASGKLLTVDYQRISLPNATSQQCYEAFGWNAQWEPLDPENYNGVGECTGIRRAFKLTEVEDSSATLLTTSSIEDNAYFSNVFVGDDRVFASVSESYGYYYEDGPGYGGHGARLMVVGGMESGALNVAYADDEELLSANPVAVNGQRLVLTSWGPPAVSVLDASDLSDLTFEKKAELSSYAYDVKVDGDQALCSLGPWGLQVVDISP